MRMLGSSSNWNASRPKGNPSPIDFRAASLSVQSWKKVRMRVRSPAPSTAFASAREKYDCESSVASTLLVKTSMSTPMQCVEDHAPRYPSRQEEKLNQQPGSSGRKGRPFSVASKAMRDKGAPEPT